MGETGGGRGEMRGREAERWGRGKTKGRGKGETRGRGRRGGGGEGEGEEGRTRQNEGHNYLTSSVAFDHLPLPGILWVVPDAPYRCENLQILLLMAGNCSRRSSLAIIGALYPCE